jgi:hypothetical protein
VAPSYDADRTAILPGSSGERSLAWRDATGAFQTGRSKARPSASASHQDHLLAGLETASGESRPRARPVACARIGPAATPTASHHS